MELRVLCGVLYWLLLPLSLLAACLFRFNGLSLVYLLYLLLLPWFLGPTEDTIKGHTGRLLRAVLGTSILFLLAHLVFQICLYTVPSLDQLLGSNYLPRLLHLVSMGAESHRPEPEVPEGMGEMHSGDSRDQPVVLGQMPRGRSYI